jgi:LacI family transcriptional regulator
MKKKVSLKDVAERVGVSVATVSYVLSHDQNKNEKISKDVTEKVKKIALELNYQPNVIAKSLQMGKTFTIGLIVADISNPFFANLARIIEDEAAKLNYTVIFVSSDEKAAKTANLIQFLLSRQVDGFIIVPSEGTENQILHLKSLNIPFVLLDRYFPNIATNSVCINNLDISYKAVNRLIEQGNNKIGIIAYSTGLNHMLQRIEGYRKAHIDNSIEVNEDWIKLIEFSDIKNGVQSAIDDLFSGNERVRAILFATNTLGVVGLKYIEELNYKVPKDVAVISFDQGDTFDFFYCPLTHIKQPINELGENCVRILINAIENDSDEIEQVQIEAELVINKSCSRN